MKLRQKRYELSRRRSSVLRTAIHSGQLILHYQPKVRTESRKNGATCAQGYFVAKPMPAESLLSWMVEWETRLEKDDLLARAR